MRGQLRVCSRTCFSKREGQERTGRDRKGEACLRKTEKKESRRMDSRKRGEIKTTGR